MSRCRRFCSWFARVCCCCCCPCCKCCENGRYEKPRYSQIEEGKNADPQISAVKVMEDEGGKSEIQEMEFVPGEAVEDKTQASDSKRTDIDTTGQPPPEHLEGVAFIKGTTARASWRLMPNALSPTGESSSLEAKITFSDEDSARQEPTNVVLIPHDVEESGEGESSEQRTSKIFTISAEGIVGIA